jgi:hypothetical protein
MMSWSSQIVLRDEFLITTFLACTTRSQLTCLASMTVSSAVIVHGPVYAVRATPAGTPVLLASGKPVGGAGVWEVVGVGGAGVGVGVTVTVGSNVGGAENVTVAVLVGVRVTVGVGLATTVVVTVAVGVVVGLLDVSPDGVGLGVGVGRKVGWDVPAGFVGLRFGRV